MPYTPSMADILASHAEGVLNGLKKCVPATVTAVHFNDTPKRQTIDCQVSIENYVFDPIGNAYAEPAPSFQDIPYGFARGAGFMVWVPCAVGDSVLLVFSDLSCDVWRAGDGSPQPPGFVGKHTHDSPFAIPFFAPDAKMLADPGGDKVIIGQDGGQAQIRVSASDIELGTLATDFVALASKVETELSKIQATLLTGANSGGTVVFGTLYVPGPVAATLVKAQ